MDTRIGPLENVPRKKVQILGVVKIEVGGVMVPTDDGYQTLLAHTMDSCSERQVEWHGEGVVSNQNIKASQRLNEVAVDLSDQGLHFFGLPLETQPLRIEDPFAPRTE